MSHRRHRQSGNGCRCGRRSACLAGDGLRAWRCRAAELACFLLDLGRKRAIDLADGARLAGLRIVEDALIGRGGLGQNLGGDGIAFGLDRLCAVFGGSDSIRDYMAFPKNNAGRDMMIDSPSRISDEQLKELNLKVTV